jgi:hypothetical protein
MASVHKPSTKKAARYEPDDRRKMGAGTRM